MAQQVLDIAHTARDLLRHLRDLVVAKVGGLGARALDLADEEVADVVALAESAELDDLTRVYQGFSKGFDDVVRSGQPRGVRDAPRLLVRGGRRPSSRSTSSSSASPTSRSASSGGAAPVRAARRRRGRAARRPASRASSHRLRARKRRERLGSVRRPDIPPESRGSARLQRTRASAHRTGEREAPPSVGRAGTVEHALPGRARRARPRGHAARSPARGAAALATAIAIELPPQRPSSAANATEPQAPLVHTVSESEFDAVYCTIVNRVRAMKPAVASLYDHAVVLELTKSACAWPTSRTRFLAAQAPSPKRSII
ncbi:MAG: hypothetical protein U0235_32315 [Polyangiaceae bacterium]